MFADTGRRLPDEIRKAFKQGLDLDAEAISFTSELLDWFGVGKKPEVVAELRFQLDAVVRFTVFVVGEFLQRNYSLEKYASGVFDQFQLHYLALDGFIIVSNDPEHVDENCWVAATFTNHVVRGLPAKPLLDCRKRAVIVEVRYFDSNEMLIRMRCRPFSSVRQISVRFGNGHPLFHTRITSHEPLP